MDSAASMINFDSKIIDIDAIKKYNQESPRYTSYPPAPYFRQDFSYNSYIKEIFNTNQSNDSDISFYFHIPFCDSLCFFCGCNMMVTHNRTRIYRYVQYLKKELKLLKPNVQKNRKIAQLHWGGGTPTSLTPDEIRELGDFLSGNFEFSSKVEKSCEIDPRALTQNHLEALRSIGFSRISMGVQDLDDQVQRAVNRIQPEALVLEVVEWIRKLCFKSLNVDLIYGLPFQTLKSFEKTIESIIAISPERVAIFNFAYVPWMKKHMQVIDGNTLPSPEEKLAILEMCVTKLKQAGYVYIGMDHFAKPSDDLAMALREKKLHRNFQGYTTCGDMDLYAFGVTGISQVGRVYAQNYKTEKEYFAAIDANQLPVEKGYKLTLDDEIRRYVILRLMCDFEIGYQEIEEKYNIRFKTYFQWGLEQLLELERDQLVVLYSDRIMVTEKGRFLIRNIAMNFDGFIEKKQNYARYSKTI